MAYCKEDSKGVGACQASPFEYWNIGVLERSKLQTFQPSDHSDIMAAGDHVENCALSPGNSCNPALVARVYRVYAGRYGMSRNVGVNALEMVKPFSGIFSKPSLGITMSFPNAGKLPGAQPTHVERHASQGDARTQQTIEHSEDGLSELHTEIATQPADLAIVTNAAEAAPATSADLDRVQVQAALRGDQAA